MGTNKRRLRPVGMVLFMNGCLESEKKTLSRRFTFLLLLVDQILSCASNLERPKTEISVHFEVSFNHCI